jgi:hypothetical protein
MEDKSGGIHTNLTNILSNNIKFILKWGVFLWLGLNSSEDLSLSTLLTNDDSEEPALTGLDLGT